MAHVIRDKNKLLNRVRRIKGQIDAVERSLEEGAALHDQRPCSVSSERSFSGIAVDYNQVGMCNGSDKFTHNYNGMERRLIGP